MILMKKYMCYKIFQLAWPVVLEMFCFMVVNVLIMAMVGSLGAVTLAAVGLSNMVQLASNMIFAAAGTGAAAIAAREVGASNWLSVRKITGQALLLGLVFGILLAITGYISVPYIFSITGADPAIAKLAVELLKITFIFTPFYLVMSIGNAILRGMGRTKLAFGISFFSNLVNLIVSYMFIYGRGFPNIGVYGVAWGLSSYQIIGGSLVFWVLANKKIIGLSWRNVSVVQFAVIRQILDISVPAALEQLAMQGGRLAFTFMLVQAGAVQFAAHQIAAQVESISFLPGFGFSVAAMTLVGQNLGRGMPQRATQYGWLTMKIAFWSMSGMGVMFLFLAKPLTSFFITDTEVIYWGTLCVMISVLEQPTIAISSVLAGALRGAGDTKWPMYITIIGVWLVRIPLVYLFIIVLKYNIIVAWIITASDFLVRSLILWRRFATNKWYL